MNDTVPERGATTLSIDTVWQGHTRLDKVRFRNTRFDGSPSPIRTWEVWRRGHAVGVLPYDPVTDQLVLIEQFRYGAMAAGMDPILLELPCGFIDGDETPEQAGAREMQEEIGMQADRLLHVGRFMLSPGGSDESVTIYAGHLAAPPADAKGIVGYGGLVSENEDIRIRVVPAAQAIEIALAGACPNSITAIGLLWFAARHDWLRAQWLNP
jgi:ADP-ribose pyrophosphatase